jgi:threonine/homoserine/homoserine lactone efflux protein
VNVNSRLHAARGSPRLARRQLPPVPMPEALLADLIKGIAVGIVIALPVGPVGVLCVRRTLFEGPMFGFVSGLGAACADTIFGIIAGFGLTIIRDFMLRYQDWFGAVGGVFLLVVGIRALRRRGDAVPEPLADEALLGAFASTFALTITNPITILAFAAIFAKVGVTEGSGSSPGCSAARCCGGWG